MANEEEIKNMFAEQTFFAVLKHTDIMTFDFNGEDFVLLKKDFLIKKLKDAIKDSVRFESWLKENFNFE